MHRIKSVSRIPVATQPRYAALPPSAWEHYKACVNEQSTLAGKKECFRNYIGERSEDKNP